MEKFKKLIADGQVILVRRLDDGLYDGIHVRDVNGHYIAFVHETVYLPVYTNTRAGRLRLDDLISGHPDAVLDLDDNNSIETAAWILLYLCRSVREPLYMLRSDAEKTVEAMSGMKLDDVLNK